MTDKQKTIIKVVGCIVIAILLLLGGFFLGRKTIEGKVVTTIEYVELPPVHDTITELKPVNVYYQPDTFNILKKCIEKGIYSELFPQKTDTEYIHITSEDTAAIVMDWSAERLYQETLFDIDTIGKCDVSVKVSMNRLDSLGYVFMPKQKTITNTVYVTKKFSPYFGVGFDINHLSLSPTFDVQAELGFFIKERYGVAVDYRYDFIDKSHSVGGLFLYKL